LLAYPCAGRTSTQNHAVQEAKGEILAFSDASTMWDRDCLRAMVTNLADPTVGSVARRPPLREREPRGDGAGRVTLFLLAALVALDRVEIRPPGFFVPLYFCLINVAPLIALWMMVKGEKKIVWDTGPQPVK